MARKKADKKANKKNPVQDWASSSSHKAVPNELKVLQAENSRLRREIGQYRSGEKILRASLADLLQTPVDMSYPSPPPKSRHKKEEEIAVLHLSDLHVGKVTSSYGTAVAAERVEELVKSVMRITEVRQAVAKIEELRVYLGGDMVEGDGAIFAKQAHQVDSSVLEQATITTPQILAGAIAALSQVFRRIKIRCVSGNHGRPGSKDSNSHPRTCWDRVTYTATKLILLGNGKSPLNKRIEFIENDDFYFVDTLFDKWGNLVIHGHEIRGGFAGYPWYGVGRKALQWQNSISEQWSYLYVGHFHTYASFTISNILVLANGALETDNEYALQNMAAAGTPVQRLSFYNERRGMISDNPVYVTERHP